METRKLTAELPADLLEAFDAICTRLALWKNCVVEAALRKKIEDLLDAEDLCEAVKEPPGFHSWEDVKAEISKKGRK